MTKIKVIVWLGEEDDHVYRLDEPGAGERFFRDMLANAETDGREKFAIEEVSQTEWETYEEIGEERA